MSLLAVKPFNYPIAINASVTKYSQIKDKDWSFTIQLSSNITTWEITHTLSEFEQLQNKLRDCKELDSIKLPRSIVQLPMSRFHESGKQIIEDYLWRLLRRAYIFISIPLKSFIELPIIMERKTNLLSKQLSIIIRDDIILHSMDNNNKYINIQCILRSKYILDAYKISNNNNEYMISSELNEGFGANNNKQLLFRIDVVQIKRVLRYQKEYKFAIETRKGVMYAFKSKNKTQFDHWLNDIKNMIKAQGGCTPYLTKWDGNATEFHETQADNLDEKVVEKINLSDEDDYLDHFDFNCEAHGPLSTITQLTKMTSVSDEKHNEYIDRVDIDIESCFDIDDNHSNSVSIEHTIYDSTDDDDDDEYIQQNENVNETKNKYDNKIYDEILSTHNNESDRDINVMNNIKHNHNSFDVNSTVNTESNGDNDNDNANTSDTLDTLDNDNIISPPPPNIANKYNSNSMSTNTDSEYNQYNGFDNMDTIASDDTMETDLESITLKLHKEKIDKRRREAIITKQKKNMLREHRERWNNNNNNKNKNKDMLILTAEKTNVIEYGNMNMNMNMNMNNNHNNKRMCDHVDMISMQEYNLLQEQMLLWQNKANRWEDMANRFERNQRKMEIKLKEKEAKYKHKIKDQHNEILTLTQLYTQSQIELENKMLQLKQLESVSNMHIQQLIGYKNKNEMRKKNSYIDGTLWKFTGDGMNNIKFNKAPRLKYVMYVPTKRKLYYSDSQMDDADTKLVNVTFISHRNQEIMTNLPHKYKNIWIKIIGQNRIVLFVAKNEEDADRWYDTIKNSLQQYNDSD